MSRIINNDLLKNVDQLVDLDKVHVPYSLFNEHFKNNQILPVCKFYLLDNNETILKDLTEYVINYDLSITCQSGQRRSLNITLVNKNGQWNPGYNTGVVQIGSKFRFDLGFVINKTVYWKQMGIFLLKDPNKSYQTSNSTISYSLCDKFGLFDGNLSGKTGLKDIVPVGVSIYQSFSTIITSDKGNGEPFDTTPILFNSNYKNQDTYYTYKQEAGGLISDILIELSKTISCDVYYNEYGNLCVFSNTNDFINSNLPLVWRFNAGLRDIIDISFSETSGEIVNHIIVKGNIANGYQFSATAKNNNPLSPYCIQYRGDLYEIISDNSLYSDELCRDRAQYELINKTRGYSKCNITSPFFLPIFDVNQSVMIQSELTNDSDKLYYIDSLSFSQNGFSMSLSNVNEIIF